MGENKGPEYVTSGISGLHRDSNEGKQEEYHKYRLRLIDYWVKEAPALLREEPDVVVNEIIPVVGGGNFVAATQSQLAATALAVIQAYARESAIPVVQVGATTVKKKIGGSGSATKVKVRDGVLEALPELEPRRKEWTGKTAVFDEVDALAIGLTYLGGIHGKCQG